MRSKVTAQETDRVGPDGPGQAAELVSMLPSRELSWLTTWRMRSDQDRGAWVYFPNYMRTKRTLINYPPAVIPPHDQTSAPGGPHFSQAGEQTVSEGQVSGDLASTGKARVHGARNPLRVVSSSQLWSSSHEIYRLPRYRRRLHLGRDKVRRQGDCETSRAGHEEGCPASHTNRLIGPTHMETMIKGFIRLRSLCEESVGKNRHFHAVSP